VTSSYQGTPFKDEKYPGGPQSIPGKVMCAYYDFGGPDVAYYDTTPVNQGSGVLNPRNGTYLNEFRIGESVDTSYTKGDGIDDSPFNFVEPELGIPYIGWTEPGEWLNYTVEVKQSGVYSVRLLYTSNRGGAISLSVDGQDATGAIPIRSTYRNDDDVDWRQWHHWDIADPIAELTLEAGVLLLTLYTVEQGQMNYAYLEFTRKE
jgi:hypothetical protein